MSTEYAGRGDAERTLRLLWSGKEPPRRGPRPQLTIDQIVSAAVAIADTDGLDQLSIRHLADRLSVGTMTLYTYIPGKHELIDLMLDTVLGELALAHDMPERWRTKLEQVAREDWALYRRHPWVLQIAGHRPVMGPNTLAAYQSALQTLTGLGLTEAEKIQLIDTLDVYVRGKAREAVDAAEAEKRTGVSDQTWWRTQLPLWDIHAGVDPALASFGETIFGEHETKFEFGLSRILDGFQMFIESPDRNANPS